MSLKDAYREKMEARLAEQQARLDLLKARTSWRPPTARSWPTRSCDTEQKLASARVKLKELARASEGLFKR